MEKKTSEFSFWKGWSQVRMKDQADVRDKIMKALNINTRMAWSQRRLGKVEPKVSEAKAIEEIFAEYGIKQVWGGV
ncbi:MAG: hypothetical protein MR982_03315 [Bacteroides pyogenes]|uniref:Uncharacterized protein n=2 Tax=Bacteroides pyogenes TaxID=310300 RepID=W4PFJ7_9BACE|nr:hypothetical protein [Bacteroides pyogenes]MCF2709963.1 hypothetical protein [Bacteroides pyogenes]MCI7069997.1 hypothetical protein [Bacteroides pyogenes]GAE14639.1 hypothetical protein JCM6292_802 [Bacteroides pyogenes JCM 6292]GAE18188.1 hypothetical protein JCM6294_1057 [Bacteroides pyogenes DSM 20611 = JCM 6294]